MAGYKHIGKRIYYLKTTGDIACVIGEQEGWVVENPHELQDPPLTKKEYDFKIYTELQKYNSEEVDFIEIKWGEFKTEFSECTSYKVNIDTKEIEFDYTPIPPIPDIPRKPYIHERMDTQENTNNEQDELIISNAANIAIMLEATGVNTISTLAIEEGRVLDDEKVVDEKSVLFNVLKRSIENGANVATTKKRIELFKRTKQLTEEEATELLAMLA